jgi:hypothetical protein
MQEGESLATVIREAKIVLADAEARDVDNLTLGSALRLLEAVKDLVAVSTTFHGGHSIKMREFVRRGVPV